MSDTLTLAEMLQEAARRHARKEALLFEGRTLSYREVDETASKVAHALDKLGLQRGDRVAIMLPNIPEFVTSLFGIQKLGAVAVPFNTMYKGREIVHILNDCGARAIITLTNFANLINEIRSEAPALEWVIVTGQRTMVFVEPGSTVAVQMAVEQAFFESAEDAFQKTGAALVSALQRLGVAEAWYKHQGGIRVRGRRIGTVIIQTIENLYIINAVLFLDTLDAESFFKVIWVPPEIKDKALEPMTSVREETGCAVDPDQFRDMLLACCREHMGMGFEEGALQRDELFGYEKTRALAYRT